MTNQASSASLRHWFLLPLIFVGACGGGGGGPQLAARLPAGSGQLTINMAGAWRVTNPRIVEASGPAQPPVAGTVVSMSQREVLAINTTATTRELLERSLGFPLEWWVNAVDGRTFILGWRARNPQTGEFVEFGVAGGAVAPDLIAVESYLGVQPPSGSLGFTRSRYELVRASGLLLPPDQGEADSWQAAQAVQAVLTRVEAVPPMRDRR